MQRAPICVTSDSAWHLVTLMKRKARGATGNRNKAMDQGNDRKWKRPMRRVVEALAQWREAWRAEWAAQSIGVAA